MKATKNTKLGFFPCMLINIFLNLEWSIPAWILLVCHFVFDISIWWFVGALALWIIIMVLWMIFIGWAASCANENNEATINKNPYSSGTYEPVKKDNISKNENKSE